MSCLALLALVSPFGPLDWNLGAPFLVAFIGGVPLSIGIAALSLRVSGARARRAAIAWLAFVAASATAMTIELSQAERCSMTYALVLRIVATSLAIAALFAWVAWRVTRNVGPKLAAVSATLALLIALAFTSRVLSFYFEFCFPRSPWP